MSRNKNKVYRMTFFEFLTSINSILTALLIWALGHMTQWRFGRKPKDFVDEHAALDGVDPIRETLQAMKDCGEIAAQALVFLHAGATIQVNEVMEVRQFASRVRFMYFREPFGVGAREVKGMDLPLGVNLTVGDGYGWIRHASVAFIQSMVGSPAAAPPHEAQRKG